MARLFGTDGVRGIANDSLTPELAYHLGRAAAYIFGQNKEHPTFLIGRDTRRSGTMLADILAAGIASAGGLLHGRRHSDSGHCLPDADPSYGCRRHDFGVA